MRSAIVLSVIAALVLCVLPATARALAWPECSPVTILEGGYASYTVWMKADSNENMISAYDAPFVGTLNQVHYQGVVPTLTMDTADLLGEQAAFDSHYLHYSKNMVVPGGQPMLDTTTTMTMPFAVITEAIYNGCPVAQIVIPPGGSVQWAGKVADSRGSVDSVSHIDFWLYGQGAGSKGDFEGINPTYSTGAPDRSRVEVTGQWEMPEGLAYSVSQELAPTGGGDPYEVPVLTTAALKDFTFGAFDPGKYIFRVVRSDGSAVLGMPVQQFELIPEPAGVLLLAGAALGLRRRR